MIIKAHMNTGCGGGDRFVARVREFLDSKPDDEIWGAYELADELGYSYTHLSRHFSKIKSLAAYMSWMPGSRPVRVFGSRKAIANFNQSASERTIANA